jgi:hypothetical protein
VSAYRVDEVSLVATNIRGIAKTIARVTGETTIRALPDGHAIGNRREDQCGNHPCCGKCEDPGGFQEISAASKKKHG